MFTLSLMNNYIKTAIRALTRHKLFLALNFFGLAVGLAATILVGAYTLHEVSYDKDHPNVARTYRLLEYDANSGRQYSLSSPHAFQHYNKMAGVEDHLGVIVADWLIESRIEIDGEEFRYNKVYAASENLLDFFNIPSLHGDIGLALSQPDKIALSQAEAVRFFGRVDVVGEKIIAKDKTWTVVAVFADLPINSHLNIKALISSQPYVGYMGKLAYTYLRLADNVDIDQIGQSVTTVMDGIWNTTNDVSGVTFALQPLLDIHLSANLKEEMKVGGSQLAVNLSIVLSLLLVFIASFSSINMSVARAGQRAAEVGIRKTLGASKSQLVSQFLIESVLLYLVSGVIACAIAVAFLADFNLLVGRQLELVYWGMPGVVIAGFVALLGILSGLYPAVFISSFKTQRVLSGDLSQGKTAIVLRKVVLVLQASISIGFVVASFSFYQQMNFLHNLPTHYERVNRLQVSNIPINKVFYHESFTDETLDQVALEKSFRDNRSSLAGALKKIDGVLSSTATDFDFTRHLNAGVRGFTMQGTETLSQVLGYGGAGYNAAQTLGLELVAGRDFNQRSDWFNREDHSLSIFIPESVVRLAGFSHPDEAIGKTAQFPGGPFKSIEATIVGVFKDVTLSSVKEASFPMIIGCGLSWAQSSSLVIEVAADNSATRGQIRELLQDKLALYPIAVESLESSYDLIYQDDKNLSKLILTFSALIVALTTIGVFGLSAYTATRRSKEIAIRKVLGASKLSLVQLLANEQIVINIFGMLLTSPIAYWLIERWLANFNQRIEQSVLVYLLSGLLITLITATTIGLIVHKVMKVKPSRILRDS
ncbi:MAG: putative ABC transport system permease protein [Phenylobacterium sp.]|jgi:putative ABC transport system permease protein